MSELPESSIGEYSSQSRTTATIIREQGDLISALKAQIIQHKREIEDLKNELDIASKGEYKNIHPAFVKAMKLEVFIIPKLKRALKECALLFEEMDGMHWQEDSDFGEETYREVKKLVIRALKDDGEPII